MPRALWLLSEKEQKHQSDQAKLLPRLAHRMGTSYLFRVTWGGGTQHMSCGPCTPSPQRPEYSFLS